MIDPQRSGCNVRRNTLEKSNLEKTSERFDQAIKNYQSCYARQQSGLDRSGSNSYAASYLGVGSAFQSYYTSCGASLPYDHEGARITAEYEQTLLSLEQAVADFRAALPQIRRLKEPERTEYAEEWKQYFHGMITVDEELIHSLENDLKAL